MSLIPLPWKIAGIAFVVLVLAGAYFGWQYHEREIGRLEIVAKDAKALNDQKDKDAKLSADLVNDLQQKIRDRENTAQPVREVIRRVVTPCSTATGPDVDAAAQWVRDVLSKAGGSATGRKPPP